MPSPPTKFPCKVKFKDGLTYSSRLKRAREILKGRPVIATGLKQGCVDGFISIKFPQDVVDEIPALRNVGVNKLALIPVKDE